MFLLKWCILFSHVKGSPEYFFSLVQWLVHLVLLFETLLARIPCPPPSSYSSPCPAGVWVWGWREAITQLCTAGKGPQRSNPAAAKGISCYVPTLSLTKSQVILEKLQDHLLICADISNENSPSPQQKDGTSGSQDPDSLLRCSGILCRAWKPSHAFLSQKWTHKQLRSFLEDIVRKL